MSTVTTNYSLIKPGVNDPTDQDLWGGYLNTDLDTIDSTMKAISDQANLSSPAVNSQTADYTVLASDKNKVILMDATGGNRTVTLLDAATAGSGFRVSVKKIDASVNTVTVDGYLLETIDGVSSMTYTDQWDTQTYICNGTSWFIIDDYSPEESLNRGCYLYQTTGTAYNLNSTFQDIAFDSEYYDDFGWHTGSSTDVTVDFNGYVEVDANLSFTSNNPNGEAYVRLLKNGVSVKSARLGFSGDPSAPTVDVELCQKIKCAPADVFKLQVWRNGGGSAVTEPTLTRMVVTKFRVT